MFASSSEDESEGPVALSGAELADDEEESLLHETSDGSKEYKAKSRSKDESVSSSSHNAKAVYLILGTEFCERFNFYGMKTILVIYLTEWLGLASFNAVAWYHTFVMLSYLTPLLGAVLADGYLGRYRTILYVSLVYAAGAVILALAALPPVELYGTAAGLFLISLGTGGIKPCVSVFGGDQFPPHMVKERTSFFSAFYFMINLGAMLSVIVTPILRADVHCIKKSCYPLAFGVPALLMVISIVIFVCGKRQYRYVMPKGNPYGQVISCILYGVKLRLKRGRRKSGHWLDSTTDKFEISFVSDVKCLLKVLWLFLPLPVFWALFDQQGSRWTLQAVQLDGNIGGLGEIKPDQLQVLNPILILTLIPVFEKLVYPALDYLRIPNRPLQRMCAGMSLCSCAFFIAGLLQLNLESGPKPDTQKQSGLVFLSFVDQNISVHTWASPVTPASFFLQPYQQSEPLLQVTPGEINVTVTSNRLSSAHSVLRLTAGHSHLAVIHSENNTLALSQVEVLREQKEREENSVRFLTIANTSSNMSSTIEIWSRSKDSLLATVTVASSSLSETVKLAPGQYSLCVLSYDGSCARTDFVVPPHLSSAQTVVVLWSAPLAPSQPVQVVVARLRYTVPRLSAPKVHMAWQIPQYVVITMGEILFSVTGLAFAYTQAPESMRSLVQAAWLMTTAFGDFVVVLVAEAQLLSSQSAEFFLFAAFMGVDTLLFMAMARAYKSSSPCQASVDHNLEDLSSLIENVSAEPEMCSQNLQDITSTKTD